jgi:PBSX family phage terminase large subunit
MEPTKVELTAWQSKVFKDTHRFIVVSAGRRVGKSTLSALKMIEFALKNANSFITYVAPSYRMAEEIMFRMIKQLLPKMAIERVHEPPKMRFELKNGSMIQLKGADSGPDALRGVRIDYLVCDEISAFRNWEVVWNEVLRPTLTDTKGSALFIGTPKGYNHFFNLYQQEKNDNDYKSYKFTSYDNTYLDPAEIDKAKQELEDDVFGQEYLAEFTRFSGLVYKEFSREKNLIKRIPLSPNWNYNRGIDFGFIHPTAVIFMVIDDKGNYIVYDTIRRSRLLNPDLAQLIQQKSGTDRFTLTVADSAQASDIAELNRYGIAVQSVEKTSKVSGEDFTAYKIRKVSEKLKSGQLQIFDHLEDLISEFENLQYHEVRDGLVYKEVPVKLDDDLLDALAYLIISLPESVTPVFRNQSTTAYNKNKWVIG